MVGGWALASFQREEQKQINNDKCFVCGPEVLVGGWALSVSVAPLRYIYRDLRKGCAALPFVPSIFVRVPLG